MENNEPEIILYKPSKNTLSQENIEELNKLYVESFPEIERIWTLEEIFRKIEKDARLELYIMRDDPLETGENHVVAFQLVVNHQEFMQTIFLASDPRFPQKMYGINKLNKYVMNEVAKNKPYIFLAETVEETAENYEYRRKRNIVYKRVGMKVLHSGMPISGTNFDLYTRNINSDITLDDCYRFLELSYEIYGSPA